jgi:inhibitor of cysteine peptidase
MFKNLFLKTSVVFLVSAFLLTGCSSQLSLEGLQQKKPSNNNQGNAQNNQTAGVQTSDSSSAGISKGTITEQLAAQSKIKKFSNYDELATFLENNSTVSHSYSSGGIGMKNLAMPVMEERSMMDNGVSSGPVAGTAPSAVPMVSKDSSQAIGLGSSASTDYSKTNIQVAGVDEADIIKTDGKYVYALARNSIFIINAYPAASSEILSKIEFKSRPVDMYISGDRLVVFGADDLIYQNESYTRFRRQGSFAFLKIFDISDRKNPKQLRDLDFEGNYQNSRLIGDNLYFITNNYSYYYVAGEPVIPRLMENGVALDSSCEVNTKCFAPDVYYFDMPYNNYNFTTVSVVNIKDEAKKVSGEVYILSSGQNFYVSSENIYITYTKYVNEYQLEEEVLKEMILPKLSIKEQDKITEIEGVKNYILSAEEKTQKISQIIAKYTAFLSQDEQTKLQEDLQAAMKKKYEDISKELEKTIIHKIAIKGDKVEYQTSGEVTGNVLNQYSMDENNGYFRIATTKSRTWLPYYLQDNSVSSGSSGAEPMMEKTVASKPVSIQDNSQYESYSNLYVLDKDLKVVGKVENLAPGEQIYSVRFMQNRAYMVTFKQTDPLFAIDLTNPTAPKVLGKLKIPGFSSYLHPYDDKLLIGLGKDTYENDNGGVRTKGLKLSLFDVSNIAEPKEVDTFTIGDAGSDSVALNDPKAFLFSKEKNLLVIPATLTEDKTNRGWGNMFFSGALVFKVNEKGFTLRGKIDHSDGGKSATNDCWWGYCYYDNNVLRSLYIDDTLYTFSNQYLKSNKLDSLETIKNLPLKKEKTGVPNDIEIIN